MPFSWPELQNVVFWNALFNFLKLILPIEKRPNPLKQLTHPPPPHPSPGFGCFIWSTCCTLLLPNLIFFHLHGFYIYPKFSGAPCNMELHAVGNTILKFKMHSFDKLHCVCGFCIDFLVVNTTISVWQLDCLEFCVQTVTLGNKLKCLMGFQYV